MYVVGVDSVVWDSQGSYFVYKREEMGGACSIFGEICVQVFVSKPEGKSLLGRPRRRWENDIKWFSRSGVGVWTEFIFFRKRTSDVFIVNVKTEIRIPKKCWKFFV
jgi:hypothetical protein